MKIFGISGAAGSGKDTLFETLNEILNEQSIKSKRLSFGDFIKKELYHFLLDAYHVDIYTCSREEKNAIRSIIIEHGKIRRARTNGLAYISQLDNYLKYLPQDDIFFITDVRFKQYEFDEVDYIKSKNGTLIYLCKTDKMGNKISPTIPLEIENDPKLISLAKYFISWPDGLSKDECKKFILANHKDLLNEIITGK